MFEPTQGPTQRWCASSEEFVLSATLPWTPDRKDSLLHSLRFLGMPVELGQQGPFWAARDGNVFLAAFGFVLSPMPRQMLCEPGQYVLHKNVHFTALGASGGGWDARESELC